MKRGGSFASCSILSFPLHISLVSSSAPLSPWLPFMKDVIIVTNSRWVGILYQDFFWISLGVTQLWAEEETRTKVSSWQGEDRMPTEQRQKVNEARKTPRSERHVDKKSLSELERFVFILEATVMRLSGSSGCLQGKRNGQTTFFRWLLWKHQGDGRKENDWWQFICVHMSLWIHDTYLYW